MRFVSENNKPVPHDLQVSVLTHDTGRYVVFSWESGKSPRGGPEVPLTAAERAVHALLLAGLSDAEIAELRGTTRSTVTKQIDAVFRKVGVRSRRELIARGPLR